MAELSAAQMAAAVEALRRLHAVASPHTADDAPCWVLDVLNDLSAAAKQHDAEVVERVLAPQRVMSALHAIYHDGGNLSEGTRIHTEAALRKDAERFIRALTTEEAESAGETDQ